MEQREREITREIRMVEIKRILYPTDLLGYSYHVLPYMMPKFTCSMLLETYTTTPGSKFRTRPSLPS